MHCKQTEKNKPCLLVIVCQNGSTVSGNTCIYLVCRYRLWASWVNTQISHSTQRWFWKSWFCRILYTICVQRLQCYLTCHHTVVYRVILQPTTKTNCHQVIWTVEFSVLNFIPWKTCLVFFGTVWSSFQLLDYFKGNYERGLEVREAEKQMWLSAFALLVCTYVQNVSTRFQSINCSHVLVA